MKSTTVTRKVQVGTIAIGGGEPIVVQSMCATKTQDIKATVAQADSLMAAGAGVVRIAVDSQRDVSALKEIRKLTKANLAVDLQESYRLAALVGPYVDKIRYNPGHLHHHETTTPVIEKVKFLVEVARTNNIALRVGVNFGSLDPAKTDDNSSEGSKEAALSSATEHVQYLHDLNFENFVVSLKSSNPNEVIEINREFAKRFPSVPLHLGVTEAGLLPMGEIKTRIAFEQLIGGGIGDTIRVSLTLPNERKAEEVIIGKQILADIQAGRFRSVPTFEQVGLNIISCPSCSRVENEAFVNLAESVRELTEKYASQKLTIAVMGCRVNGPGETDDADFGLWCAPKHVNFKRKGELVGTFSYEEILPRLMVELEKEVN